MTAVYDDQGRFYGHEPRECGEHRTVGEHRAWCFDCSEWCYPRSPCIRCEVVELRKRADMNRWKKEDGSSDAVAGVLLVVGFFVVIGLLVGGFMGIKAMSRYQKRQDAMNQVRVSEIMIRNQEQRVKITQQEAQIRIEGAKGIRAAQDEIQSTLTPLFVQFEMVEAMKEIARSGRNSSVIFMPSGAGGVPLVYDTSGAPQVLPAGTNEGE